MGGQLEGFEFTKASSKGQVVIPAKMRKRLGIREGSILAVVAEKDMIVLKKADPKLKPGDLKTLKLVEEAWADVENGRYRARGLEGFFGELESWGSRWSSTPRSSRATSRSSAAVP